MKIFLTSSLGTNIKVAGKRFPCEMNNTNGIIDILKSLLTVQNKLVLISSNPVEYEINDDVCKIKRESFVMSGFNFKEVIMLDKRNANDTSKLIETADLIVLCGGHVPTQNKWFKEINLKQNLRNYNRVLVGESAGSMNCAGIVYCCPELEGEAIDSKFNRWIEGLGLTDINIFPHYNELENVELDGFKYRDIILSDSLKKPIYTLNDGSFIEINGNKVIVYGACSKISNGEVTVVCENNSIENLK